MNNTMNQTNNIKRLPTQLNYFYLMDKKLKRHREVINVSRIMILILLVWNLLITTALILPAFSSPIPQFTDKENQLIMQLEEIPTEQLQFEPIGE